MRYFLSIALFFVAFACKEITYPAPQPKGKKSLTAIPDKLHGNFRLTKIGTPDSTDEQKLVITRNGIYDFKDPNDDPMLLGDSLVVRQYKGLYFFNQANKGRKPDWSVAIMKPLSNGDLEVSLMTTDEKQFKTLVRNVSAVVTIDSTARNGEKLYQIDPTPKQLMVLMKKGYFSDKFLLKRIK
jgi:hypothetical protein